MIHGKNGQGMSKHRTSGHVSAVFVGKQAGKRKRRVGKGLNRKQRERQHGSHKNKYTREEL